MKKGKNISIRQVCIWVFVAGGLKLKVRSWQRSMATHDIWLTWPQADKSLAPQAVFLEFLITDLMGLSVRIPKSTEQSLTLNIHNVCYRVLSVICILPAPADLHVIWNSFSFLAEVLLAVNFGVPIYFLQTKDIEVDYPLSEEFFEYYIFVCRAQ